LLKKSVHKIKSQRKQVQIKTWMMLKAKKLKTQNLKMKTSLRKKKTMTRKVIIWKTMSRMIRMKMPRILKAMLLMQTRWVLRKSLQKC
jgi:hypothetical protein